jgi:hypothetical protein
MFQFNLLLRNALGKNVIICNSKCQNHLHLFLKGGETNKVRCHCLRRQNNTTAVMRWHKDVNIPLSVSESACVDRLKCLNPTPTTTPPSLHNSPRRSLYTIYIRILIHNAYSLTSSTSLCIQKQSHMVSESTQYSVFKLFFRRIIGGFNGEMQTKISFR